MLTAWTIRICRADEAEAVLALWRQAEATPDVTGTIEDLTRAIVDSPAIVLVAEAEGRLIGSIIGSFDGWRGNIYRLAVHPDFRHQGIARALVAEIEQRLAKQGAKRMIAPVERDHPWAMSFWRAVNYEVLPNLVRFVRDL
jgi:ribosomal protein S18 acetylase RimI-like enzyme